VGSKTPTIDDLVALGISATRFAILSALAAVTRDAQTYLGRQIDGSTHKAALRADLRAEDEFETYIHTRKKELFSSVFFLGEERPSKTAANQDLSSYTGLVALVDAIDGSDLFERRFGNWCCASVFFRPNAAVGSRIEAAFVGLPSRDVYYATSSSDRAWVKRPSGVTEMTPGTSGCRYIKTASLCFYGQKVKNLLTVTDRLRLRSLKGKKYGDVRIYNLAGIPLLVRMIDHVAPGVRGIDMVFEISGQQPHDAIAGLFIAKKGGATIVTLDGEELTYERMEEALLHPGHPRMTYVAAATLGLAHEFIKLIKLPRRPKRRKPNGMHDVSPPHATDAPKAPDS
jgi:fructose-1,6-bisphosphatase/inositol monophosphatase family enzyme